MKFDKNTYHDKNWYNLSFLKNNDDNMVFEEEAMSKHRFHVRYGKKLLDFDEYDYFVAMSSVGCTLVDQCENVNGWEFEVNCERET